MSNMIDPVTISVSRCGNCLERIGLVRDRARPSKPEWRHQDNGEDDPNSDCNQPQPMEKFTLNFN